MRKQFTLLLGVVAAVVLFGGVAYSAVGYKLVVNGKWIQSDTPPQIVNGRMMVPIRAAAEALGANVQWQPAEHKVTVDMPDVKSLERQIQLLQEALAPASADEAVTAWANAVQKRNGAEQYAYLSDALRNQTKKKYEDLNWVTGLSSPWVDSFKISDGVPQGKTDTSYDVTFKLKTSTGDAGEGTVRVTVSSQDDRWPITGLKMISGSETLGGIVVVP